MQGLSFRDDILPLKDKLFRLALRITLNREEAEDIVQETMMRVWSKRDEWQQFNSIEAYCLTVAKNLALDRSELKDVQAVELPAESEPAIPEAENPHERLVSKERLMLVHRFIHQLPVRQRAVLQLRDVEGKSYKEIAALLDLTEEQVKVNLFRGRQKVKQWFINTEEYGL